VKPFMRFDPSEAVAHFRSPIFDCRSTIQPREPHACAFYEKKLAESQHIRLWHAACDIAGPRIGITPRRILHGAVPEADDWWYR
jgi:hypothetical protein